MAPLVRIVLWCCVPILLRQVLRLPDNDTLAKLDLDETKQLYAELGRIHFALDSLVQEKDRFRYLLRWGQVEEILEQVIDLGEALAWSADPELRANLEEAVGQVLSTGVLLR